MGEQDDKRLSKRLSLALRHEPASLGIELDEQGWTSVEILLANLAARGVPINRARLEALVATNDKQRFRFSEDGQRIRANQGHSVEIELGLAPQLPPEILYHGTVERFLASIFAQGLLKGQRHHVHLSSDLATAQIVGRRRGASVILTVAAGAMSAAGHTFYRSDNGVWLVDHVPPQYLRRQN